MSVDPTSDLYENRYHDEVAALVEGFRYELCGECAQDLDAHAIVPDPLGHPHAVCLTGEGAE